MSSLREVNWMALTCTLEGTDIYLGLAAGLDDVAAHRISAQQMVAFPYQHIRIASGDDEEVPLRVYAVRDPSIIRVEPMTELAPIEGFTRVRLHLVYPAHANHKKGEQTAAQAKSSLATAKSGSPANGHVDSLSEMPVMAFLLAIGLGRAQEDDFYRIVVDDFLKRSWITIPRLLREIGCSTPREVAAGDEHACPSC